MSLSKFGMGTLKLLELGVGEGHVVLKFRVGNEIVQCKVSRNLSAFKEREVTGNYIEYPVTNLN